MSGSAPPGTHTLPPRPSGPPPSLRSLNQSTSTSTSAFQFRPRQVAAPQASTTPPPQPQYQHQPQLYGGYGSQQPSYGQQGYSQQHYSSYQQPSYNGYGSTGTAPGAVSSTIPHIVNPFPPPPPQQPSTSSYGSHQSGHYGVVGSSYGAGTGGIGATGAVGLGLAGPKSARHHHAPYDPRYPPLDPEMEAQIAQQQSIYIPQEQQGANSNTSKVGTKSTITSSSSASSITIGPVNPSSLSTYSSVSTTPTPGGDDSATPTSQINQKNPKAPTVIRHGGGKTWTDPTLLEWDPAHFRLFVGNLAGEVTDESLLKAFAKYPSVQKARVIRDKRTTKSKGYGFVSFSDGDEYFRAAREMQGKYIGSHPVLLKRSKTEIRPIMPGGNKKKDKIGGAGAGTGANAIGAGGAAVGVRKKKKDKNERKVLG